MVIDYLSKSSERNEFCFEADLFPYKVGEKCVEEIVSWLKGKDHMKADRIACGSQTVEKEAIEKILDSIENLKVKLNSGCVNFGLHMLNFNFSELTSKDCQTSS